MFLLWIGEPAQNERLIVKIKELLTTDNISPLTPEEFKQMNAAQEEIRNIAAPGGKDESLKKILTKTECVNLSARYWAPIITDGREASLQDIEDFYGNKSYRKAVTKETKKLMKSGNIKRLSTEELYELDACNAKFSTR